MAEHPHENTSLLAKENKSFYGGLRTKAWIQAQHLGEYYEIPAADEEEGRCMGPSSTGLTEEVIVNYNEIEFCFCWKHLNLFLIEPLVFILLFAYNLSSTILKNQIIYQTCTAIFLYNDSYCLLLGTKNASNHTKEIETEVQPYAARIFMTTTLIESIIPTICGVFIGAWSDRFGRKPLLLAAFFGYSCNYIICGSLSYLSTLRPLSPWYYLLATLPLALLGGNVSYTVAAFCFISDVASPRERPYRMVFYEAALYVGFMAGSLAAGYIYEATNSTVSFSISAATLFAAFIIVAIFLPESLHYRLRYVFGDNVGSSNNVRSSKNEDSSTENVQSSPNTEPERNKFSQIFDFKLLQQMWLTCFKPRSFYDRSIIWLLIAASLTSVFVINGSMTVFYLFIREQFHWTVREYTTYETFSILASTIGNLFGIWLLRKVLKITLINLAIIAYVSQVVSYMIKGFAFMNWHIYLAICIGALKSLAQPMARTIISNIVPADELGKIFSFQGVLQALMPFLATPAYTLVYSITLNSFPGFFNVLSANLFLLGIAFLLVVLRKRYQYPEHYGGIFN